jgi:hypothetical protein
MMSAFFVGRNAVSPFAMLKQTFFNISRKIKD